MLSEEEKEAIESVKSMFGDITIEKLIKDKIFNVTICSLGILDILRVIAIVYNLQKEIEEKTTILLAGAEKVKQLEKGNRSLMESRIKWKNRYYKEKEKNKENQVLIDDIKEHRIVYIDTPEFEEKFISKDKIREKLDKYRKKLEKLHSQELWNEPEDSIKDFKYNHYLEAYKELLEEK